MTERPLVMTPEQVAVRWECSPSTVRREVAAGRLPAFRLGGKLLRIKLSDVEQYECQNSSSSDFAEDGPSPSTSQELASVVIGLKRAMQRKRRENLSEPDARP
jgi:excisionase family DNA binding protein